MARAEELLFAHHGSHTEDNATKNLCWLLNNLPWEVSREMLQTLLNPIHADDVVQTVGPNDVTVEAQEDTFLSAERAADAVLLGIANRSHNHDKTDVARFEPSKPPVKSRTLDLTIEMDGHIVVGIEAKKGSKFDRSQLRDHARELSSSSFGVATWEALSEQIQSLLESDLSEVSQNSITGEAVDESTVRLLLSEYRILLRDELIPLWKQLGTSPYTTGENSIRLTEGREPKHKAIEPDEEHSEVPFTLVFQSVYEDDPNGDRLFFSPKEWQQLISSMDNRYVDAFEKGELKPIVEDYKPEVGHLTVAEIKNSAGTKKYIRYGDRGNEDNEPLLHFNKSTASGGNLRDIPMYNEDEFSKMFGSESSVTKLFTQPEEIMSASKQTGDDKQENSY